MKHKQFAYLSLFLFFLGIIFLYYGNSIPASKEKKEYEESKVRVDLNLDDDNKLLDESNTNIKLSFIGDSMLASLKGERVKMNFQDLLDTHDYSYPFKNVSHIFKEDDFSIANGENVFTDRSIPKANKNHTPAYWYYTKSKYANIYRESGIEVVSVMNNHTYDYGVEGYLDTIQALKKARVIVGAEEVVILEKEGVKIGILCINLFHRFQYENCLKEIKKIKEKINYIIVYFHGGIEYSYAPSKEIVEYSHGFIDNGADLVIGCHPHVLEPIEIYQNKKIVYSLGSFIFGGTKNFINRTIIYQINLEFNQKENKIMETDRVIPCYLYTNIEGYESWIPSVIENLEEKQKVLDFMEGKIAKPF